MWCRIWLDDPRLDPRPDPARPLVRAFGTTRTPDDAHRYAKGEAVPHLGGIEIRLRTPPDFLAVTDHADDLGRRQAGPDPPDLGRAVRVEIVAGTRHREVTPSGWDDAPRMPPAPGPRAGRMRR